MSTSKETGLEDPCYAQTTAGSQHLRTAPTSATSDLPCKSPHQRPQSPYNTSEQPKGPAYWDNLSTLWFTRGALRELDRRNNCSELTQEHHRSVTHQGDNESKQGWKPQFAPDFLSDCPPGSLKQLKRFSRNGGPDLSDIRGYPEYLEDFDEPMDPSKSITRKRKRNGPARALLSSSSSTRSSKSNAENGVTKGTKITTYSRNFLQHLIDHGIFPEEFEFPDGETPAIPNNWDEIQERLARRRPSLSPSGFSNEDFREFRRASYRASKEKQATASVVSLFEGDLRSPNCAGGGYLFGNLAHLTDGTLAKAKPDRFYGAQPLQLNPEIREELSNQIVPSSQSDLLIAPSFFLEAKGPDGTVAVAGRQACYDGALGARGIYALQTYLQEKPIYDNNAYTITATYTNSTLTLFTTHITQPRAPGRPPEYVMSILGAWAMKGSPETFRQGACAYRNARDWAREKRDEFIRVANERFLNAQARHNPAARHPDDDAHASTVPLNAEGQDTQSSLEPLPEVMEKVKI